MPQFYRISETVNPMSLIVRILGIAFFLFLSFTAPAYAGYYDYGDTILVVNDASATSTTIANYFITARSFPPANVMHINTPEIETISTTTFTTDIRTPVENFLTNNHIASSTNYIILTKGVPLNVNNLASVDQALSIALGRYSGSIIGGTIGNPYNPQFSFSAPLCPNFSFSSAVCGYYAVTRLDGYTILGIESMIDRSANATTTNVGTFVLDTNSSFGYSPPDPRGGYNFVNGEMVTASNLLTAKGYATTLDLTTTYVTYQNNILGYYSWGSNDGNATTTNSIPHNTYVNGSIGDTAVSSSGRTFNLPATYGQSLMADWLAEGISGVIAYTSEPYTNGISEPNLLFDYYTNGFNFGDSAFHALPEINWKEVVVGDPKMIIVRHQPFDITAPLHNAITSSVTPTFSWRDMVDYYGISKYQLYVDGVLNTDNITGTSTAAAVSLSAGTHTWYIKAIDNNGATATSTSTFTLNVVPGYTSNYTFYVDNVLGSDNNPGSQAAPWATFAKVDSTVQPGNTVVIIKNAGIPYRETLLPVNSGTATGTITFRGVDINNKPEIWGSTDVSGGWSVYSGGNVNTYQKLVAATSTVLSAGPSLSNLTLRTNGTSTTLSAGAWYEASNILYYRLASGEDITTLHIEAGARDYGIKATQYNILNNIIVRYANVYGLYPNGVGMVASGIEAYNNHIGIVVSNTSTLQNSIAANNVASGINSSWMSYAKLYNNLSYGNGLDGINVSLGIPNSEIKNNIVAANSLYPFQLQYFFSPSTGFTTTNNLWDIAGDTLWESTYKGTANQELVDPLLTSTSTSDFTLTQFSPAIDNGTPVSTRTTDILGNPIYGTPDIGPYEYQPPYIMGTDALPQTGALRIYGNGKYRYTTATSSAATTTLTVTPVGGFGTGNYAQWMDIGVTTWHTSGDFAKTWTESSPIATSTVHTVGNLNPTDLYNVAIDGATPYTQVRADNTGTITFTYTGGYSTHTFSITKYDAGGVSYTYGCTNSSAQNFNASATSDDGTCTYAAGGGSVVLASTSTPLVASTTATNIAQPSSSSTPAGVATTTLLATASTHASSPSDAIQQQIILLQERIIVLLKQLILLLV